MIVAPLVKDEVIRLKLLEEYDIMDTLPEKDFDDITRLASEICNTPISLVSLIDRQRQWFKSRVGLEAESTHRDHAFCAHALLNPTELMIVQDSSSDERFFDNPLVTGAPNVLFYAGIPLVTECGQALGTLCVIDNEPRNLNETQKHALKALGNQVMNLIELRYRRNKLEEINRKLESYNYTVAHDLKSPLAGIIALVSLLKEDDRMTEHEDLAEYMDLLSGASSHLSDMIVSLLEEARKTNNAKPELVDVQALVHKTFSLLFPPSNISIRFSGNLPSVNTCKLKMLQVFQNLLSNAIKYNDKKKGIIEVGALEQEHFYRFYIKDNGPGIPAGDEERIFGLFETTQTVSTKDSSTGVGLSLVKDIITEQSGRVWVESAPGEGSCFYFLWRK
ncbi:MAG: sensor histidine kinase [Sphingobacteriales bacterium]|nr:MAG: sensor histidine kinase [Sphingobacteriales bacterium]